MQVRQSPKAKVSPDKNNANWPPKSPYEALLSSPSGRKRWEEAQIRYSQERDRSISPSPRRRQPPASNKALQALTAMSDSENGDEDEEELQLRLEAIQAKLKLKKLQRQKSQNHGDENPRQPSERAQSPRKRQKTEASAFDPAIQIAVSPIKERMPPPPNPQPTSPARVLLGIDKGLRASDVSLKRARSSNSIPGRSSVNSARSTESERPKQSFSERIAASRLSTEHQQAKQERIERARSNGFGLSSLDKTRSSARDKTSSPALPTSSSFSSFGRSAASSSVPQSPFLSNRPQSSSQASTTSTASTSRGRSFRPAEKFTYDASTDTTSTETAPDGSSFESFSSLHLSRRKIPHTTLARALDNKQIYTLPRLLKEVKAPTFEPPDCEQDFVVFAIIASKSSPYDTRPKHQQTSGNPEDDQDHTGRTKFMVMKLTDLKWELDLFLFDTAFDAFWKMTPGTLVAMLNPTIMPPKTHRDSGQFSLKLSSSEDSVMEIGSARDLGFCSSLKKNGQECNSWVNARKSKFCDYHVELAVDKTRATRMEVNSMYRPNSQNQPYKKNSSRPPNGSFARNKNPLNRDNESGERYFMVPGSRSAASLLDAEDLGKADALRRRLKEKERDRLLAEKLGATGTGQGAAYLQRSSTAASSSSTQPTQSTTQEDPLLPPLKLSAADLGLKGKSAQDVRLSPVRTRRKLFSMLPGGPKTSAAGPEAFGWGGNAKRGILNPGKGGVGSPEKGQTNLSATRIVNGIGSAGARAVGRGSAGGGGNLPEQGEKSPKKARFQLPKGIREPGRDSIGGGAGGGGNTNQQMIDLSDDDDDLEII